MSYNSTQFWHDLPGDSIRSHRLRAQSSKTAPHPTFQMLVPSPGCHLSFCPTGYRLEIPTSPSLSSVSFLEWLTEPRETFYLLGYWLIIKGHNSRSARWKRYPGKVWGKSQDAQCPLQVGHSPSTSSGHQLGSSLNLSFWALMGASLYNTMID